MKKTRYLFLCILCFFMFSGRFAAPVEAAGKNYTFVNATDIYSGWYSDTQNQGFGYLGAGFDHNIDRNNALAVKIFLSYLYYNYESGPDVIKAKAPELKLFIGKKYINYGSYFIISGGIITRNTSFNPDDRNNPTRGSKTGAILEADYNKDLSENIVMNLLGDYTAIGNSFWARGRFKYLTSSLLSFYLNDKKAFIGAEVIGEGNKDYSSCRIGPFYEIQKIKKNFSVLLGAGYRYNKNTPDSGYFTIELYHRF